MSVRKPAVRTLHGPIQEGGVVIDFRLSEDFRCPTCQDRGVVEVSVGPVFGLPSEGAEARKEWRVCQCQKGEALLIRTGVDPERHGRKA